MKNRIRVFFGIAVIISVVSFVALGLSHAAVAVTEQPPASARGWVRFENDCTDQFTTATVTIAGTHEYTINCASMGDEAVTLADQINNDPESPVEAWANVWPNGSGCGASDDPPIVDEVSKVCLSYKILGPEGNGVTVIVSGAPVEYVEASPLLTNGHGHIPTGLYEGGTGNEQFALNAVLIGNGGDPINVALPGSPYEIFRMPVSGGAPAFGAIDLSQAAAVTGTLTVENGGTGAGTALAARMALGAAASGANADITSLSTLTSADVSGTLSVGHLKITGSTPTITTGAGAGAGATASVVGTDVVGQITVTTGSSPSVDAVVATITFANTYGVAPTVILIPANGAVAGLTGQSFVKDNGITTAHFKLKSGNTALDSTKTYKWNYLIIE